MMRSLVHGADVAGAVLTAEDAAPVEGPVHLDCLPEGVEGSPLFFSDLDEWRDEEGTLPECGLCEFAVGVAPGECARCGGRVEGADVRCDVCVAFVLLERGYISEQDLPTAPHTVRFLVTVATPFQELPGTQVSLSVELPVEDPFRGGDTWAWERDSRMIQEQVEAQVEAALTDADTWGNFLLSGHHTLDGCLFVSIGDAFAWEGEAVTPEQTVTRFVEALTR